MSVLQFPSASDRQRVHDLIIAYAHAELKRDDMMRSIARIIEQYHCTIMPVLGYSVRLLPPYCNLPIISIEGATLADACPVCGAATSEARYLRTEKEQFSEDHDIISVTCLECGCVYHTKGDNGRKQAERRKRR